MNGCYLPDAASMAEGDRKAWTGGVPTRGPDTHLVEISGALDLYCHLHFLVWMKRSSISNPFPECKRTLLTQRGSVASCTSLSRSHCSSVQVRSTRHKLFYLWFPKHLTSARQWLMAEAWRVSFQESSFSTVISWLPANGEITAREGLQPWSQWQMTVEGHPSKRQEGQGRRARSTWGSGLAQKDKKKSGLFLILKKNGSCWCQNLLLLFSTVWK